MNEWREISFTLEGVPPTATAQQKGAFVMGGHVRFFKKAKVKAAERTWREMLTPHRAAIGETIDAPAGVSVRFVFPYLASTPKRIVKAGREIPQGRRPDLDNLLKALLDTMTQMTFWRDDGLITALHTEKWRGPEPRTEITISKIGEQPPSTPPNSPTQEELELSTEDTNND